jgi:hypothetical protein
MIAAAAMHADCDTLWSEDMQGGIVLDPRLPVVSPFRAPWRDDAVSRFLARWTGERAIGDSRR